MRYSKTSLLAAAGTIALAATPAFAQSGAADTPPQPLPPAEVAPVAAPLAIPPAPLAAAPETGAGVIVVTANRREQNLQDVGMSVSVTSGETLRALNLTSATDIAQVTPGVWASGNLGGQSQQFSIRGVTQSDFNDAIEAPVAVYVRGGRVGLNRDWQRLIPDPVRADS